MANPSVGIIILNWNNAPDTIQCITAVLASDYEPYEIIVVDNNSHDDSVQQIRAQFPQVTLIQNPENLGYAQGNNVGMQYALERQADYILILNDDTVVAADMLSELVKAAQANPKSGILGPKIYSQEEPQVLLTTGAFLGAAGVIDNPAMGVVDAGQWDRQAEVGYLWGAAVLLKDSAVRQAGMLDPEFFAYQEDIDWCYRIRAAGYQCLFIPQAKCWHPDTRRARQNSALVTYYMSRNHLLFIRKHHLGFAEFIRSWAVFLRRILSWSIRPKWKNKRHQRDALVRGLMDYTLGRFGKANFNF